MTTQLIIFYVYDSTLRIIGKLEAADLQAAIQLAEIEYPGHHWVDAQRLEPLAMAA